MLGIDPGLARTGIGVITRNALTCSYIHHDVVRTSTDLPLVERLAHISAAITAACQRFEPQCAATEKTFVNVNLASSLTLGQARGAALAALGLAKLPVHELAPTTVKARITGNGSAEKSLVATMVKALLNLKPQLQLPADASDALAIALCYAMGNQYLRRRKARRRK